MPSTHDIQALTSDQWRDLYDRASLLERALRAGTGAVDLRRFLPPPEAPHRRAVLHELIKTELEVIHAAGQGCLLETYLQRYPELGGPDDLPAGLLHEEYRLRCQFGDRPSLDDYRRRFPHQFEQFRLLVEQQPPEAFPATVCQTLPPPGQPAAEPWQDTLTAEPMPESSAPTPEPRPNRATAPAPPSAKPAGSASSLLPCGEGYQLLERIGTGQFGEVHRARAPGGVVVAVKRVFRSMDDESCQRELKALERVRELRHPFLLQTHNYYALENHLVIVMELADGSLQDQFKECIACGKPGIPSEDLLAYFREAAEALDFLHEEKLIHRDIKPQNLLHLKGHAKVADFGIARSQEGAVDQTLHVGGTPAYMPPEMWRGAISIHSDQYSFAVSWYEMRTGRRIFPGSSALMDLAQQHLSDPPDLSELPPAEERVLRQALAKEPEDRFPSCMAFVLALREAVAAPAAVPLAKPVTAGRRRVLRMAVASLAVALIAGVAAVWARWGWSGGKPAPGAQDPPKVEVSWQPRGWQPQAGTGIAEDRGGHRYYRRLVREVAGQPVVMVAVPQTTPADPPTFYILENKVANDLFGAFMADPQAKHLLKKYSSRPGCEELVHGEWQKGAYAPSIHPDPTKGPYFGVSEPSRRRLPVFRVTVTEAHCFAEWLGGSLPTRQQWRKATGWGEDTRAGPFEGSAEDPKGLAVNLTDGPWAVDRGGRDVSIHGCRQMASNGFEWTRDLGDDLGKEGVIPLDAMNAVRPVYIQGQSYLKMRPLTFKEMADAQTVPCTEARFDVTFRVVLEP